MIVLSDKVSDDAMGCTRSYRKAGESMFFIRLLKLVADVDVHFNSVVPVPELERHNNPHGFGTTPIVIHVNVLKGDYEKNIPTLDGLQKAAIGYCLEQEKGIDDVDSEYLGEIKNILKHVDNEVIDEIIGVYKGILNDPIHYNIRKINHPVFQNTLAGVIKELNNHERDYLVIGEVIRRMLSCSNN